MTSPDCRSGSDRVREVAASLAADVYVNVQGDEPLLEASAIERLRDVFTENVSVQVATLCSSISEEQARSPHQVKVIRDHAENALYFSRAPLPFVRESGESTEFLGHVGIYAYRADALRGFASLPFSPLEQAEKAGTAPFSPGRYCHPRAGSAADGCGCGYPGRPGAGTCGG